MRRIVVLILAVLLAGVVGYAALTALRDSPAYGAERVRAAHAVPGHSCRTCRGLPSTVRRWCPVVRYYWGRWQHRYRDRRITEAEVRHALLIMQRESRGLPYVRNGQFHGLFQIWWRHAPAYNLFRGPVNVSVAGQMYVRLGWGPWAL